MDAVSTILAQLAPGATTETQLYSVPRDGHALIQELLVCNRGAGAATFRVSISLRGAATSNTDYLYYDNSVNGNVTFSKAEMGLTLNSFDVIRVYASSADLTFTLFGSKT